MRLAAVPILSLAFPACSGFVDGPPDDTARSSQSPIEFGSPDAAHTAVVALGSATRGCSGTIVRVKTDGTAYVLTAAHCCIGAAADIPATVFVGQDVASPTTQRYAVNTASVYYDAGYRGTGSPFDFCMLTFSGAPAATPFIALPAASGDGLTIDAAVEHVGYGLTFPPLNQSNTQRYHGTNVVDMPSIAGGVDFTQQLTYSAAGPSNTPGTCPGDSGGPTLFPAGATPSAQVVVGVQSFGGPSGAGCGAYTFGGDSRVLGRIGDGRFVTTYLADGPMTGIGIRASTPVPTLTPRLFVMMFTLLGGAGLQLSRRRPRAVRLGAFGRSV